MLCTIRKNICFYFLIIDVVSMINDKLIAHSQQESTPKYCLILKTKTKTTQFFVKYHHIDK